MNFFIKKYFSVLLSFLMILSLCSCGVDSSDSQMSTVTESISTVLPTLIVDVQQATEAATEIPSTPTPSFSEGEGESKPVNPSDLPAYSGIPYTIVNNNKPIFSAEELTTIAYERYANLDALGRCGMAIASCGIEIMPGVNEERGSISNIKPSGWMQASYKGVSGGYLWNRCHLIGWQLSAENANRQNLITGTRYMNVDGMLAFENMVADYIRETNNHVAYRITPIFIGNNLVCSGVQMEAYSIEDDGEGICFNVYCYNVQPNITIDYVTGSSSETKTETALPTGSPTQQSTPRPTTEITPEPTAAPSIAPTVKPATLTPAPATESEPNSNLVWIPKSGKKYHSYAGCSNMKNPSQVTKQEAVNRGFGACSKCW